MPRKVTASERLTAIRWLLDIRFTFSVIDELKRDYPEQFNKVDNGMMRGIYNEALREKKRLQAISYNDLIAELRVEVNKQNELELDKKKAFERIEADEQVKSAKLKHYEDYIQRQKNSAERLRESSRKYTDADHATWEKLARQLKEKNSALSVRAIAIKISKSLEVPDSTIRAHLQRNKVLDN